MRIMHGYPPLGPILNRVTDKNELIPVVRLVYWPHKMMHMNRVTADLIYTYVSDRSIFNQCVIKW